MEIKDIKLNREESSQKGKVHFILSHSYIVFLFAVIFGVVIDIIIPFSFFTGGKVQYFGVSMILLGSLVIYWAQSTSKVVKKNKERGEINFEYGPYKYLRSPTHFGLFIMTLGLAVVINSPFSIIFTIIAYIITKLVFIKKEEKILAEKYGETYNSYKNKVKNHI